MGASKQLFDAIRRMLGRGLTQAEVDEINIAAGTRTTPDAPSLPEEPGKPLAIGGAGLALIKEFEGCAKLRKDGLFEAYPDPGTNGDPWTIGWGATGQGIEEGTVWTQQQCDDRLELDMQRYAREVAKAIGTAPTSQWQFDALVSFHYNTGAIATATLTRKHKAGDFEGAALEFGKWVNAGGRRMAGLVRRRAEEARLYRRGS